MLGIDEIDLGGFMKLSTPNVTMNHIYSSIVHDPQLGGPSINFLILFRQRQDECLRISVLLESKSMKLTLSLC